MTTTVKKQKAECPDPTPDRGLIQVGQPSGLALKVTDGPTAMLLDPAKFNQLWRVAQVFAKSGIVPEQYRGHVEDCMIALYSADLLGIDPMMYMQNTYMVKGKPGMEAKLAIALVNTRGPFKGPIQWKFEGEGESRKCTAFATHAVTGSVCESVVSWAMVKAEGWSRKDGSKWLTMPDQMFQYRSAMFLARLFCPEVLMGMQTTQELRDTQWVEATLIEAPDSHTDALAKELAGPDPDIDTATGEVKEPGGADEAVEAGKRKSAIKAAEARRERQVRRPAGGPGQNDQGNTTDARPGPRAKAAVVEQDPELVLGAKFVDRCLAANIKDDAARAAWNRFVKIATGRMPADCGLEEWAIVRDKLGTDYDIHTYVR
jgi:hypothetical protein